MLLKAKTRLEFDNSWVRQLKFVEHTDQDLAGHVDAISIKSESGSVFDFYRSNPLENPDDFKYTALYNKIPQVKNLVDHFQLQTTRVRIHRQLPGQEIPIHTDDNNTAVKNKDDYMIRALSLPSKYGVIYKTYITQESDILNNNTTSFSDYNDNTLCLYILSKNNNGLLTLADPALKQNLKTYLAEYRMVTDAVAIKDAFIINLGINFDVIMLPNFNNRIVLNECINALKVYFDTDKWQINQPILINNVKNILDTVEGVQTIKNLTIVNKSGSSSGYSEYAYDIEGATIDNVLYPSLDPSIFEVRFPDIDIQGRVVTN